MLFQAEKQGISLNPRKKPGPAATANKKGRQKDGKFSLPRPAMPRVRRGVGPHARGKEQRQRWVQD